MAHNHDPSNYIINMMWPFTGEQNFTLLSPFNVALPFSLCNLAHNQLENPPLNGKYERWIAETPKKQEPNNTLPYWFFLSTKSRNTTPKWKRKTKHTMPARCRTSKLPYHILFWGSLTYQGCLRYVRWETNSTMPMKVFLPSVQASQQVLFHSVIEQPAPQLFVQVPHSTVILQIFPK